MSRLVAISTFANTSRIFVTPNFLCAAVSVPLRQFFLEQRKLSSVYDGRGWIPLVRFRATGWIPLVRSRANALFSPFETRGDRAAQASPILFSDSTIHAISSSFCSGSMSGKRR